MNVIIKKDILQVLHGHYKVNEEWIEHSCYA